MKHVPNSTVCETCGETYNAEAALIHRCQPGLSTEVAHAGIVAVIATILGATLTLIATGLQGGSLVANQRQAVALESIAETLKLSATPVQTPRAVPMVFEDSAGSDICSIVEDGDGGVHIEGDDPAPCERFLWARYGETGTGPDL